MNISRLAINNYQFTITAFVFLLVMGVLSFVSMPQREDPALEVPNVLVTAVYPGASPEDLESQVVDPIEEAVNELDDIKEITGTIRDGVGIIEVEFEYGVDTDDKFDAVQRQVNQVRSEMPTGLYELRVRKFSTQTVTILQLGLVSDSAEYSLLESEAERVKDIIEDVDGVRKVEIEAYPEQEVRIAIDPLKMSQMNISLEDLERAVQSNNANIPGGALKVSDRVFNIKTSGAYDNLGEIRNTVVGAYQGKVVYLRDVADVYFDYEDERWEARVSGTRCLYVNVQQKEGVNIFDVTDPIQQQLNQMVFADGIRLHYIFNQADGVEDRVDGFLANLLQGVVLVGVIIFLALGNRSAYIVMMAIPLSILIGLWVVSISDYALQQMSIAGLIVALGLLVDNSIAIIENIERLIAGGQTRKAAASEGAEQLKAPIASATLTTVLAFIPIILIPDTTGAFIQALPVTVIATLTASLIIALTLTPLLASWILKDRQNGQRKTTWASRQLRRFIEGPYRRTLHWAFRYKWLMIGLAVFCLFGALALFPLVGISFFPKAEKPQFRITVSLPNGSNLDATDRVVRHVEGVLDEYDAIEYYAANVGHGNPRIYYNVPSTNFQASFGEVFVKLKQYDVDKFYALLDELRGRFDNYPHARIDLREYVQGPPSEAPVAIKIFGNDLDQLQEIARRVENIVRTTEGALNVENPIRNNSTDLFFNINRDKAMMLGVPIHRIDNTIRGFVNGTILDQYRDADADEYNIVVRYDEQERFRTADFDRIEVQSAGGSFIPLRQLANVEFKEAPSRISHLNMDRTATILADIEKEYNLNEVINPIRDRLDAMDWPEGYSYTFKGDLENRNESFGGLGAASLAALIMIFGVLIVQFRSFSQPLIIFSALPLAIIGSILALLFTGISFSFTAFIGLTSLIGIAINNSIVLVDFSNHALKQGATVQEAAIQGGEVRFIPIVMTTLTTILGLLPLTLTGGSLWAPMGWTIIGGLITSTTFVLLIVPLLYQLFTREG